MSTLLDAKSTTVAVGDGPWMKGWDNADRMCGLHVYLADYCGPADSGGTVVGDGTRTSDPYAVRAFAIMAEMDRSPMCSQDDDEKWSSQQLKDAAEQAFTRAMCVPHADGSSTWIGDAAVAQAADIAAGRAAWYAANVGRATLHLSADMVVSSAALLDMKGSGVESTVWGDEVVIGNGYPAATAFWAGPVALYLSTVATSTLFATLKNGMVVQSNMIGAIDMAPCTVVRIGAIPVDPSPIA